MKLTSYFESPKPTDDPLSDRVKQLVPAPDFLNSVQLALTDNLVGLDLRLEIF